ncbi:MAG: protein kinase domain-containing protein [Verrucomicrobiales bacterium]
MQPDAPAIPSENDPGDDGTFLASETLSDGRRQGLPEPPVEFMASCGPGLAGELPGDHLGSYTLIDVLGEGGFGTVWRAEQQQPVQRTVAVKIIKPGMDSREVLARFEQERQALARMEHPAVVQIFDAGATPTGRPYFVMELISGEPVTRFCDARRLDTASRLRLMLDVCAAVRHAHQKGIIHRDLKPSNILVAEHDGRPAAKIIDFGVAKAVSPNDDSAAHRTRGDQLLGTPTYMSPEQAGLEGADVDTRSDVYSLGVVLYQLLTGMTPLEGKTSRGASLEEIRRLIREEDPPPPSTAVHRLDGAMIGNVLHSRQTALREFSRLLRRDLDWIVMKAIEKDQNRRYESVGALAADLQRFLVGEPVTARPPTFGYRAGKFIRRRKGAVAAAALVLLSLVGGLAASTTLYLRANEALRRESVERNNAQREATHHALTSKFLSDLLASAGPDRAKGTTPTVLALVEEAAQRVGFGLENQPAVEAALRNTIGSTFLALDRPNEAKAQIEAGLAAATRALGDRDRLTLRLRGNLANVRHASRDYPGAEAENRALLALRQDAFPPDDIETLATRDNFAAAISKQGRFAEAAAEYSALRPLQEQALGKDHPDTLRTRMALANTLARLCLDDSGRVADAEKLNQAAAEYRAVVTLLTLASAQGPEHTQTLEARYGLADVLYFQKNFAAAEKEHREVFELRRKILSPTHKKTFQSQAGVARALYGMGQLDQALAAFSQLVADQVAAPDHDEGDYRNNLKTLELIRSAQASRSP